MSESITTDAEFSLVNGAISKIPNHIAVIMDGNGRWAEARSLSRLEGHQAGGKAVRKFVEMSIKRGVKYVTLFSFSTENWNRGEFEVNNLMMLFKEYLDSSIKDLIDYGIRLHAIGDIEGLPSFVQDSLKRDIEISKHNTTLNLVLAINYGAREEIVTATKKIAQKVKDGECNVDDINQRLFSEHLWSAHIPEPDLLIRTSGELRISNFLLWQLAYSELLVINEYWPDFDEEIFNRCIAEYSRRERRFGYTSDQIKQGKHLETARQLGYELNTNKCNE